MPTHLIGVDLGGTHLRAVRMDETGAIHAHQKVRTAATAGPEAMIDQIVDLVHHVTRNTQHATIAGIGVGVAGPVAPYEGVVLEGWTMSGWHNVPLRDLLQERTQLPVAVHNDGNIATVGEWQSGAGRGCDHFVYVTVSTGIGGGVIADGRLRLGRKGMAAELGHMIVDPNGPVCNCGNHGCGEAFAAGTALARKAKASLAVNRDSLLHVWAEAGAIGAKEVIEAARQGVSLAQRLVENEAESLGIGIVALLHLYSPERIALGGGQAAALPLFLPQIEQTIRTRAMPPFRELPVAPAALGDNAGVIGAGSLFLHGV